MLGLIPGIQSKAGRGDEDTSDARLSSALAWAPACAGVTLV